MRGTVEGALSALPFAPTLPAMIREDPFAQQLCAGLDEVLAPVVMSLDAFPAYLDLATTPPDMLPWLGHWLGMEVDPVDTERLEALVAQLKPAHVLHRVQVNEA